MGLKGPGSRRFTPFDLLLAGCIAVLAVMLIAGSMANAGARGEKALVKVGGGEAQRFSLAESGLREIQGYNGITLIEVADGRVHVVDSACPDKICVHAGWIDAADSSIVCMPNRVVIEIEGEGGVDAVNR